MAQEADLKSVGLIAYGFESRLRYHLIKKIEEKINESNLVIDLLKNGQMFEATRLYHEIHEGSTVKESLDMVKKIEADMDRFQNPKHCCSNCGFDCGSECSCVVPCNDCSEWVPKYG